MNELLVYTTAWTSLINILLSEKSCTPRVHTDSVYSIYKQAKISMVRKRSEQLLPIMSGVGVCLKGA